MYCSKDCTCSLCRELRGFKPKIPDKKNCYQNQSNFILKRRLSEFDDLPLDYKQHNRMRKSQSHSEINFFKGDFSENRKMRIFNPDQRLMKSTTNLLDGSSDLPKPQHKVVIYFGDSISKNRIVNKEGNSSNNKERDIHHANLLLEETAEMHENRNKNGSTNLMEQLKKKIENPELKPIRKAPAPVLPKENLKVEISKKNSVDKVVNKVVDKIVDKKVETVLPNFIESVVNGVINIKIEENFEEASRIVKEVSDEPIELPNFEDSFTGEAFDWSFVQEWRSR